MYVKKYLNLPEKRKKSKKTWRANALHAENPALAVCAGYDLHFYAGGSPLPILAAPNVHLSSKRRREVCNRAGKSNIPIT